MSEPELTNLPLAEFLDRLGSGAPTPGGGSAAALAGAMATGLISMVCNLTAGRERFKQVEGEVRAILNRSEELRRSLQTAIERDAEAYEAVIAAFRLPKGSDDERKHRSAAIQEATRHAAMVPLEIAELAAEVLGLAERAVGITNPKAASDLAVAALLAGAAIEGSAANVETNLQSLNDGQSVESLRARLGLIRSVGKSKVSALVEAAQRRSG